MEGQPDAETRNQDQMNHEKERAEDEWNSWRRGQVRNTLYLVSAAAQWILLLTCLIYLGIDSLQPSTDIEKSEAVSKDHLCASSIPGSLSCTRVKELLYSCNTRPNTWKSAQHASQQLTCSYRKPVAKGARSPSRLRMEGDSRRSRPLVALTRMSLFIFQAPRDIWTHIRYTGESIEGVALNLIAEVGFIQIQNGSIIIPCDGLYLVSLKGIIHLPVPAVLKLTLWKISESLWEQTVQGRRNAVDITTVLYLFKEDNITLQTSSNATIEDLSFSLALLNHCK
ncbi:uncharacterized protein LOC133626305 [Colius striatus]|uniref:uncharacterized protein LOC133626305 n=1 Tax=Colius striatus TaxID=57412 RepID=UPI002B1CF337|nr:uncharacterized protein LOC133626305 [Colius striatus]